MLFLFVKPCFFVFVSGHYMLCTYVYLITTCGINANINKNGTNGNTNLSYPHFMHKKNALAERPLLELLKLVPCSSIGFERKPD